MFIILKYHILLHMYVCIMIHNIYIYIYIYVYNCCERLTLRAAHGRAEYFQDHTHL